MATSTKKTIALILLAFFAALIILNLLTVIYIPIRVLTNPFSVDFETPSAHFLPGNGPFPIPWWSLMPLFILSLVWIGVAIWVYKDAEKLGMNGLLWGLLVFIGSIIGLIIYLIVRNDYVKQPVKVSANGQCPTCSGPVKETYAFCPRCGNRLKDECSKCGKSIETQWQVCPYCGAKLVESKSE